MKPNYYAIIPAEVRYNNELTANAKLLFGELTALSNKTGICWATNKYFAELYQVDKKTVSRWIQQLQDNGFITTVVEYDKDTKLVIKRSIKITTAYPRDKNVQGGQKDPQGGDKNVEVNIYNNNSKNNTSNNTPTFKKVADFKEIYLKAYEHIKELFPPEIHPKNTKEKIKWLNVIRLADEIDKVNPRQLYFIIQEAKKDSWWSAVQYSFTTMRDKNNKSGLRRIDQFKIKFGKDNLEYL